MDVATRARSAFDLGRATWERAREVDAILAAAGVAFFALLSLVPAMGAVVAVYGLFADPDTVTEEVSDLLGEDTGPGREWILDQLVRLTDSSSGSLTLAAVAGVLLAVWSASSGVRHLQQAVDGAFGIPPLPFVRARARGLAGMAGIAVAAALIVAVLSVAPGLSPWLSWLRIPLVVAVVLLGSAYLFRPGGARGWAPPGAVVTTVVWVLGSIGLAVYVSRLSDLEAAYGAFASVVIVMLWLWVSAIAVLAGAHLTAVLHGRDLR